MMQNVEIGGGLGSLGVTRGHWKQHHLTKRIQVLTSLT